MLPDPLLTPRLRLLPLQASMCGALVRYFVENRGHLAPWDPARPEGFETESFWRARASGYLRELLEERAVRWLVTERGRPDAVIGTVNLNNVVRGVAHYCDMGYSLDHRAQGKGLMFEAVSAVVYDAFVTRNLHRVRANYMPRNRRSAALLARAGFTVEGYARDFLLIAGRWEDHVLTAKVNRDWRG